MNASCKVTATTSTGVKVEVEMTGHDNEYALHLTDKAKTILIAILAELEPSK